MLSLNAMAYDFSYTYQGKTLYYNITSDNTVEVTYYSSDNYFQNNNYVSGDVVIPSSVTNNDETYIVISIGNYAFSKCNDLFSVTIPESVTIIGDYAFDFCSDLFSVTIPESVTTIGRYVFRACSELTSVTIPKSVTTIGNSAFANCSNLTNLRFNAKNCGDFSSDANEHPFSSCPIVTINIVDSVQSIPANFARGLSGLTSVTIGNNVTTIGDSAFWNCSSLSTLNFNAKNCSDFSSDANEHPFYHCPIVTINIGDSVQRIPANFARGLSELTSVTIGNSVTSIGCYAFQNCTSLSTLNFNAINCSGFTPYISTPFSSCPITIINIGESVERIPEYFTYNISSLTSIIIPNSVTSIGNYAFYSCKGLTSIVSNAVVPPMIDGNEVFPNPNSCNVIVPCGSLETYTSSQWNDYFPSRIEQDCSVSLQEVESTREFVVYPNPVRGFATVEFEALQEHSLLRIADLGGRIVKTFDLAAGTESVRLDLRDLPSGVYTLMIGNTTKKLIVE